MTLQKKKTWVSINEKYDTDQHVYVNFDTFEPKVVRREYDNFHDYYVTIEEGVILVEPILDENKHGEFQCTGFEEAYEDGKLMEGMLLTPTLFTAIRKRNEDDETSHWPTAW